MDSFLTDSRHIQSQLKTWLNIINLKAFNINITYIYPAEVK